LAALNLKRAAFHGEWNYTDRHGLWGGLEL
jgi:hypothetical protein